MLLRAKIKNKEEVAARYLKLKKKILKPTLKDKRSITLKQFSCALCLRFLNDPVTHSDCSFYFCRECLRQWSRHFPFCNRCKQDLSAEQVDQLPTDEVLLNIVRSIRIECSLGKCLGENGQIMKFKSENDLAMIEERTIEYDSIDIEKPKKVGFWKSFFALDSEKMISTSRNTSMNTSISQSSFLNSSLTKSGTQSIQLNKSHRNSLLMESKRYFSTQDYAFHLMRKHFWPSLEIRKWKLEGESKKTYVSSLAKDPSSLSQSYFSSNFSHKVKQKEPDKEVTALAFTGYKNGKKLGPGVVYFVRAERKIDTHLGAFVDDLLDNEATIFRNGKLVYDGAITKGVREGFATQRFYFEIEDDLEQPVAEKDRLCYLEYKGHFVNDKRNGRGEVNFYGNLEVFADYFLRLKEFREMENLELGVIDSYISGMPLENPVITNHVDSKYNVDNIFKNVPVVPVDSQEEVAEEIKMATSGKFLF